MSARVRVAMVLGATLLLGWALGVTSSYLYARHTVLQVVAGPPEELPSRTVLWVLERRVGLDDTQRAQAQRILRRDEAELQAIHRSVAPRIIDIRTRQAAELRPLLSEPQQRQLDEMVATVVGRARATLGL